MTLGRPAALRRRRNRQSLDQTRRSELLGQLSAPLRQFLATESGSALLMVSTTVAALMWAHSAWSGAYQALWATEGSVVLGDARLEMDLRHWINNGLMAVFFFVIGLEVRRDLSVGELTDRRRVVLPVLGGHRAGWCFPLFYIC
jgi:Na+/H+ antiporter NhaA